MFQTKETDNENSQITVQCGFSCSLDHESEDIRTPSIHNFDENYLGNLKNHERNYAQSVPGSNWSGIPGKLPYNHFFTTSVMGI